MSLVDAIGTDLCVRFVQTLLHFLWQGLLIAVAVAGLNVIAQRRSAAFRYRAAATALLLMAACLPATFLAIAPEAPHAAVQHRQNNAIPEESTRQVDSPSDSFVLQEAASSTVAPQIAEPAINAAGEPPRQTPSQFWVAASPYIVGIYVVGVLLMMTRLVIAFGGGERLRRSSLPIEELHVLEVLRGKAAELGLRAVPAIACCDRVLTPIIVGVFKPTILLPVCLLSELSLAQLEAVLAHELAHIRRWDHIANLIQRVIESVLFFHPAVWYVSRCVSRERENCCDDMVVAHGTQATSYAELLVRISELGQSWPVPSAATLAATGGKPTRLRERVLRLLGQAKESPIRLSRVAIVVVSAVVLMAFAGSLYIHAQAANSSADSDDVIRAHIFYRPDGTDHYRKIRVGSTGTTYKTLLRFFPNASTDVSGMGAAGRSAPLIVELERRDKTRHRISCDLTQFWDEGNGDRQLHDATGLKQFLDETYYGGRYVTWVEFVGDDRIEVEAVSRAPFGRIRWWGPEGVGCGFELDDKERNPAAGNYLIAIRHETDASARKFEVPGALVVNIDDRLGGLKMIQFKLADAAATTATLRVGVAAGPWTTVLRTTEPTKIEHKLGSIEITAVKRRGSRGSIAALIPRAFSELNWDLIAVDRNGNPHHNDGEDATDVDQPGVVLEEFEFDLGSEEIQRYELRTRPFRFVTFRNIRLRPAEENGTEQSALDVGVTVDRWIDDQLNLAGNNFLDFETGTLSTLPAAHWETTPPGKDAEQWIAASGVDAIGDFRSGLTLLRSKAELIAGEWEAITLDDVRRTLADAALDSKTLNVADRLIDPDGKKFRDGQGLLAPPRRDESAIHAFETSDGTIGIVQILQVDHQTQRQKLRYKLLGNAKEPATGFSRVFERELTHETDMPSAYLNLKSGKHVKPASWNLKAIKEEFHKAGVDLFHSPFQSNGDQCLCRDMDVVEVANGWKLPVDQVEKTLEEARTQGKSKKNAAPIGTFLNPNVTYVFETRDGSRGVLELLADEREAGDKMVRYKLVQAPKQDLSDEEPVDKSLSPVIERELTIDTDQATAYLNLKTGKHVMPTWDAFPDAKTLRAAGVDVYHASILSNHTQKMCLDVEYLAVEDGWKLTASKINELLDRAKLARRTKQGILDPSASYLFETRDGSRGVLELVPDKVKPTVLTTRYKLVGRRSGVGDVNVGESSRGSARFEFAFEDETMQSIVYKLRRKFRFRLCFENLDFTTADAITLGEVLMGLETQEVSFEISENGRRRLEAARRLRDEGLTNDSPIDLGLRFNGQIQAATTGGLFAQLTQGTPYTWTKIGDTFVIYPREGSRLKYPVLLQNENQTVNAVVDNIVEQRPADSMIGRAATLLGPVTPGQDENPMPWLRSRLPALDWRNVEAMEALCRISELAEPDCVWELAGYRDSRTLSFVAAPKDDVGTKEESIKDESRADMESKNLIGAWSGGQKVMQRLVLRADGTFDLSYPETPRIVDVIPESGVWSRDGKTLTLEITKSADKDRMGKKVAREVVYLTDKGLFLRAEDGICTHFTQARVFHGWTLLPWFASISKEDLPDFWEERPAGSKSYEVRPDVEVIYSDIDGTVYYRADKKLFLIQSDPIGSSTQTFYGPHEGDPRKLLNLPVGKEADDKEPEKPRTGAANKPNEDVPTTSRHVVTSSSKDEVAFLGLRH